MTQHLSMCRAGCLLGGDFRISCDVNLIIWLFRREINSTRHPACRSARGNIKAWSWLRQQPATSLFACSATFRQPCDVKSRWQRHFAGLDYAT